MAIFFLKRNKFTRYNKFVVIKNYFRYLANRFASAIIVNVGP